MTTKNRTASDLRCSRHVGRPAVMGSWDPCPIRYSLAFGGAEVMGRRAVRCARSIHDARGPVRGSTVIPRLPVVSGRLCAIRLRGPRLCCGTSARRVPCSCGAGRRPWFPANDRCVVRCPLKEYRDAAGGKESVPMKVVDLGRGLRGIVPDPDNPRDSLR